MREKANFSPGTVGEDAIEIIEKTVRVIAKLHAQIFDNDFFAKRFSEIQIVVEAVRIAL